MKTLSNHEEEYLHIPKHFFGGLAIMLVGLLVAIPSYMASVEAEAYANSSVALFMQANGLAWSFGLLLTGAVASMFGGIALIYCGLRLMVGGKVW